MNTTMNITSRGELGYRLTQSSSRLESKHYLPTKIWTADKACWPGDWEGRTILGLVSLWGATKKEPSYLEEILDILPSRLNELGYMGEIYPDAQISEQQLAGNSWLLRGLIEYTYLTKSNRLLPMIEGLVRNLYLPIADAVADYPVGEYEKDGSYSGTIIAARGRWLMSSDVGCAFISMDGISAAYELLGWEELLSLFDSMVEKFKTVDFYGTRYQTHATLSALRGIMRMYRITQKEAYLELVKSIYALYLEKGTTENHSNTTRFRIPKWTEPCGIVDSYMLAVELYRATNENEYLETAQKIYLNAISHVQLPNGGMGLENCVGHNDQELLSFLKNQKGHITEAYWCCTMRGADGLAYVSNNQCIKTDNTYSFIHLFDCCVTDGNTKISIKTDYPYDGRALVCVEGNIDISLKLFIPDCMSNVRVNGALASFIDNWLSLNADGAAEFLIEFDIPLIIKKTADGLSKLYHGLLLLGCSDEAKTLPVLSYVGNGIYSSDDGRCFEPVGRTVFKSDSVITDEAIRILFDY
ncbi:MAG: hypothetical protein E7607_04265 [Ruminococcaceae bacterium]|nr:hypothetical protein [Oscillospiraceae bacterium]